MARINVDVVNPFLNAVVEVLSTMAQVRAAPGSPYLKQDSSARGDVSGLIGITGEVQGTIAVTFSERCALAIVGNMLGERMTCMDECVIDAVGELTNVISGKARQGLEQIGQTFSAAIPQVITGQGHAIVHCGDPVLCLAFTTLYGDIIVEVAFGDGAAQVSVDGAGPRDKARAY
ncbi:chemotaxis protein CheX [Desulfovibrio ferrophilus]|uniref:Putative inhibitor of MCP methylation, CheC n=1 Tax=Desulfovibrio ferrophilus TaxID=241368 RepID=A0A2Z6B102_9BACT|nr:chemotaxis protein CheX [Desulfovibrio ferrophilus]BBD09154.1 putative inhibitor of MCP methylation, CheC [Desulfovibrio ferrophilus]